MLAWVLHDTVTAALLAGAVFVLSFALRRRPALVHALWLLVLVRLIAPVPLPAPDGAAPSEPKEAAAMEAPNVFSSGLEAARIGAGSTGLAWLGSDDARPLRRGLLAAWILGGAILLAREWRRAGRVRALVGRALPADDALLGRVDEVAAGLGVQAPRVCVLPGLAAPFVWSLGRPVLVLPVAHATRAVLAHELAHLRRRDHWTARFEFAVLLLHWWNPVFHLARRELRRHMELACDAWVVRRYPDERLTYARSLVDAVDRSADAAQPGWVLGVLGGEVRALEARLRRLVDGDGRRVGGWVLLPLVLAAPTFASWESVLPVELPRTRPAPELSPVERELLDGFGAGSWAEAEAAARAALALDPDDGQAWRKLSMVQLAQADYEGALVSLEEQARCEHAPVVARYNQACAYARLGRAAEAFATLEIVLAADGLSAAAMRHDPDLQLLTAHPQFEELLERVERASQ